MAEAPLKREYVLVLPDLVHDGQHKDAVGLLSALLQQDSQFTAPVLESLSSLQLDEEDEEEICGLVIGAVVSSKAADLPAIVRFLLAHLGEANATEVTTSLRHGLSKELLTAEPPPRRWAAQTRARKHRFLTPCSPLFGCATSSERCSSASSRVSNVPRSTAPLTGGCSARSLRRATRRASSERPWLSADKAAKLLLPPGLLRNAVAGHREALLPHFQLQISLAAGLVRSNSASARTLGGQLYALLFETFWQPTERREPLASCSPMPARAPPPRPTPR